MATKTLAIAALAATIALAGCVSPYEDAIKADLANCQGGDKWACATLGTLQSQDAAWHAQKNQEVGNAILGVLAVGLAGASIAAAAHASPPAPVFVPPPPPPPVIYAPRW